MRQEIKSLVEQLQKDDSLDRQYKVVKKHGILGLEAMLRVQDYPFDAFYDLHSVPPDCPWFDCRGMAPAEAIAHIFKPVAAELPIFIKTLQEKCQHIFVLQSKKRWQIGYFSDRKLEDGQKYFSIVFGDAPNKNPTVSAKLKKANWVLPESLCLMYSVHGVISADSSNYIHDLLMPPSELIVMGQQIGTDADVDLDYSLNDLLMFSPDGAGNGQCFYRQEDKNTASKTVDWGHETLEISRPIPFFRFLDEKLWRELIDEESDNEYPLEEVWLQKVNNLWRKYNLIDDETTPESLELAREAVALEEYMCDNGMEREGLGGSYNNMAYSLHENKKDQEALLYIEKALAFVKKQDASNLSDLGFYNFTKAEILFGLKDYNAALEVINEAILLEQTDDKKAFREEILKKLKIDLNTYQFPEEISEISSAFNEKKKKILAQLQQAAKQQEPLQKMDLSKMDFGNVDLTGIIIENLVAEDSGFKNAIFNNAELIESWFSCAVLDGASFDEAVLGLSTFNDASMRGVSLKQAVFTIGYCEGANLTKADLTGAELEGSLFFDSNFSQAILVDVKADHAGFNGAKLTEAQLRNGIFTDATFNNADLTGADLSGGDFTGADFSGAKLDQVKWDGAILKNALFDKKEILKKSSKKFLKNKL